MAFNLQGFDEDDGMPAFQEICDQNVLIFDGDRTSNEKADYPYELPLHHLHKIPSIESFPYNDDSLRLSSNRSIPISSTECLATAKLTFQKNRESDSKNSIIVDDCIIAAQQEHMSLSNSPDKTIRPYETSRVQKVTISNCASCVETIELQIGNEEDSNQILPAVDKDIVPDISHGEGKTIVDVKTKEINSKVLSLLSDKFSDFPSQLETKISALTVDHDHKPLENSEEMDPFVEPVCCYGAKLTCDETRNILCDDKTFSQPENQSVIDIFQQKKSEKVTRKSLQQEFIKDRRTEEPKNAAEHDDEVKTFEVLCTQSSGDALTQVSSKCEETEYFMNTSNKLYPDRMITSNINCFMTLTAENWIKPIVDSTLNKVSSSLDKIEMTLSHKTSPKLPNKNLLQTQILVANEQGNMQPIHVASRGDLDISNSFSPSTKSLKHRSDMNINGEAAVSFETASNQTTNNFNRKLLLRGFSESSEICISKIRYDRESTMFARLSKLEMLYEKIETELSKFNDDRSRNKDLSRDEFKNDVLRRIECLEEDVGILSSRDNSVHDGLICKEEHIVTDQSVYSQPPTGNCDLVHVALIKRIHDVESFIKEFSNKQNQDIKEKSSNEGGDPEASLISIQNSHSQDTIMSLDSKYKDLQQEMINLSHIVKALGNRSTLLSEEELNQQFSAIKQQVQLSTSLNNDVGRSLNVSMQDQIDEIQEKVHEIEKEMSSSFRKDNVDPIVPKAGSSKIVREIDSVNALVLRLNQLHDNKVERSYFNEKIAETEEKLTSICSTLSKKSMQHMNEAIDSIRSELSKFRECYDMLEKKSNEDRNPTETESQLPTVVSTEIEAKLDQATQAIRKEIEALIASKLDAIKEVSEEIHRLETQLAELPNQSQIDRMIEQLQAYFSERIEMNQNGTGEMLQNIIHDLNRELGKRLTKAEVLSNVRKCLEEAKSKVEEEANAAESLMIGRRPARCLGCDQPFSYGVNPYLSQKQNHNALPTSGGLRPQRSLPLIRNSVIERRRASPITFLPLRRSKSLNYAGLNSLRLQRPSSVYNGKVTRH